MLQSTALHEMWTPLFRMAEVSGSKDPSVPNPFERRIQSSMDPSAQMVFVMDLATNGGSL